MFYAGSDDNLTYSVCWRFKYDPVNNELLEEPKFFWHNWGHVNSINYNPIADSLIMGNGGADYELANKIYIIPNASAIKDMENGAIVSLEDYGVVLDVSEQAEFGKKLKVFWADTVGEEYTYSVDATHLPNMAYAYSDDMNKFHILALGFDSYQYQYGTYVEPSGNNRWNGTYNIIKTYQIGDESETIGNPGSYSHCGQGGTAIGDTAFVGIGHSDYHWVELFPSGDTMTQLAHNRPRYNKKTGNLQSIKVLGLDVTDRYLILATSSGICFVPR
jgi:hypothetical protein